MADTHPTVIKFLDAWKALDEEAYSAMFAEQFDTGVFAKARRRAA